VIAPATPRLSSARLMLVDELTAELLLARTQQAGLTVWPHDIKLAAKAVREGRWAVLLGDGSVLYVSERPQAGRQ